MNRILIIMSIMVIATLANSQTVRDMVMDKEFAAQVKSIDEFIQRFNGNEYHPATIDSSESRTKNLIALFDSQMPHAGLPDSIFIQNIMDFVNHVEQNHAYIQLTDTSMYAEVLAKAEVMGKKIDLTLILQSQTYGSGYTRWAITGVKGLSNSSVIDTKTFYGISPVEHEIHFMGLGDIFENGNEVQSMSYRGKDTPIDELSVLLTLGMTGNVTIYNVEKLTMHCLEVPGYAFTINEYNRRGYNSGWLISSITKLEDKNEYIKNLLGK